MTSIWLKCIFSKSTPRQQYTRQQPSTSNAYLSTPMYTLWAKIGWVSIFKKQIPTWRKWPQFESCQMYILKIYYSSTIHQKTTFNLKCIFVHSHAHPLSKNWLSQQNLLSQHIFKKIEIPNWRKWPQFESCQMYIFKIYYSSTIHQTTTFNLKCIFIHSHAQPLSKNWLSQHIFKNRPNWQMTSIWELPNVYFQNLLHQQYTSSTSNAYLSTPMHTLWAKIGWVSIFLKRDSKLTQMTSIWELPNVYFQNLLLINNTLGNSLQPQMHICPLPCIPFEQKLGESAYF